MFTYTSPLRPSGCSPEASTRFPPGDASSADPERDVAARGTRAGAQLNAACLSAGRVARGQQDAARAGSAITRGHRDAAGAILAVASAERKETEPEPPR